MLRRFPAPAAFGRLCVETQYPVCAETGTQPAAFGRLCVETASKPPNHVSHNQPPSGGCVLKRFFCIKNNQYNNPAAFGRLCVETLSTIKRNAGDCTQPPSGGCVLKPAVFGVRPAARGPAAFGRLCVETEVVEKPSASKSASRLRAAVC